MQCSAVQYSSAAGWAQWLNLTIWWYAGSAAAGALVEDASIWRLPPSLGSALHCISLPSTLYFTALHFISMNCLEFCISYKCLALYFTASVHCLALCISQNCIALHFTAFRCQLAVPFHVFHRTDLKCIDLHSISDLFRFSPLVRLHIISFHSTSLLSSPPSCHCISSPPH